MRHLARHCMSNQPSGPRADTRTGQIMPHRRSSDVASAVWLIDEESISRTFTLPSVMGVTNHTVLAPTSVTVVFARNRVSTARRKRVTFKQSQSTVGPFSPVICQHLILGAGCANGFQDCSYGGKRLHLYQVVGNAPMSERATSPFLQANSLTSVN